jgi:hypothetical protein
MQVILKTVDLTDPIAPILSEVSSPERKKEKKKKRKFR